MPNKNTKGYLEFVRQRLDNHWWEGKKNPQIIPLFLVLPFEFWRQVSSISHRKCRESILCRHIGHSPLEDSRSIQVIKQCCFKRVDQSSSRLRCSSRDLTMWNAWLHLPCTIIVIRVSIQHGIGSRKYPSPSAQSSPGNLQVGHVPSNWTRQMPHTSSSGIFQCQVATAFHSLMATFIVRVG